MSSSSPSYQNENGSIINTNTDNDENQNQKKPLPRGKIIIGIILLAIIIFVIVDSFTTKYVNNGFRTLLEWVETNLVAGVFAFIGVYFVATVAFIPGSILTLGIGFVLGKSAGLGPGVALASLSVFVGAYLGATASFLLGRYLLRDWVGRNLLLKYPTIQALDEAFKQQGFRIFVLLRLSPIVPFNAINYIGGVTSIKLAHYALSLFFILPGTVLYCFIGATAGSLTESESAASGPVAIVSIVVGLLFGLLAVFAISYYAKREFNTIIAKQGQEGSIVDDGADEEQPQQQGEGLM